MNARESANGPHEIADKNLNAISVPLVTAIREHNVFPNTGAQFLGSVASDVKAKFVVLETLTSTS
jgi:hypothetical protein